MSNIPPDDPKRTLTVAQSGNLPHIGLVGDTYTITVRGEDTNGRFCVIDMCIPPGADPRRTGMISRRRSFCLKARSTAFRVRRQPHEQARP